MYTFEDDQETSSTLRQRDIIQAQHTQQAQGTQDILNTQAATPDESVGGDDSVHDSHYTRPTILTTTDIQFV